MFGTTSGSPAYTPFVKDLVWAPSRTFFKVYLSHSQKYIVGQIRGFLVWGTLAWALRQVGSTQ